MNPKPLSYESLKAVLQYTEANLRFQISHCCPTIRNTEKLIPLNIGFLQFENQQFTVNKTIYKVGIYRKYHGDKVPELIQEENNYGGVDYDLDQFGFANSDAWNVVLPGDVLIKDSTTRMLTSNCPRTNVSAPFDNFLQLTIASSNGTRIERVNYNKKVYEAQKFLSCILFGNRLPIIQVKSLNISHDHMVIRLPLGVVFKIRELETSFNLAKMYEALRPIVDESSYPLEVLDLIWARRIPLNPDYKIMKDVKKIIMTNLFTFQNLSSLQNSNVHVSKDYSKSEAGFIILIRSWLGKDREVGTVYTFGIRTEEVCTNILESINIKFGGIISKQRCIIIPMNPITKLKVSYKAVTIDKYFKEPWLLKMEIVPIESEEDNVADAPQ